MTLIKAQAELKNNMRRINKKIIQQGSNHVFMSSCLLSVLFPSLSMVQILQKMRIEMTRGKRMWSPPSINPA
ncbi:bet1-like protein [Canna indica]|uniref:Bet1-like protein n=1 Tax=Canna indica TaxID=4628 RepID=A0AAQ3QFV0_9LILI|nr:bet1-like protein [Canna indica]